MWFPKRVEEFKGAGHNHLLFESAKSATGQPINLNWLQFTHFLQSQGHAAVIDKHSATLFSPWSPLVGEVGRKASMIGYTSMIVFDLDGIDTIDAEEVQSWCGSYAALVHTTYSHDVDGRGCYRIYMSLSKPVDAVQYKKLHEALCLELSDIGSRIDPTCADFARCYFLPSCPPDRQAIAKTLVSFGGGDVDVDALLCKAGSSVKPPIQALTALQSPALGPTGTTIDMPPPTTQGGRNTALCSAVASAYGKGFTPEAVLPVALRWVVDDNYLGRLTTTMLAG